MKKFWDKYAKSYDENTEKTFATANSQVVEQSKAYCKKDMHVLDIGCGTGLIIKDIAPFVCDIKAIDTSEEMIAQAKRNSISNITWEQRDLFSIPTTEHYSLITAFNVLLYLPNIEHSVQRIHTLLNQDGYFISVTDCLGEKHNLLTFIQSMGIKLGVFPPMANLKISELKTIITSNGFDIIYEKNVYEKADNYLIIAKKRSE